MFGSGNNSNPGGGGFSFGGAANTSSAQPSIFGAPAASASGGDKPSGFGGFGGSNASSGFGALADKGKTPAFGGFGNTDKPSGGGFAAFAGKDKPSGFGGFGGSNTASGITGGATGFGAFATASKTSEAEGPKSEAPKTLPMFGSSSAAGSSGGNLFGSSTSTSAAPSGSSSFPSIGSNTSSNLFGSSTTTAAAPAAFPKIGSTESSAGGGSNIFGAAAATTAASSTLPVFGASGASSGSMFGTKTSTIATATATPAPTADKPAANLFGSFAIKKGDNEPATSDAATGKPAAPAFGGFGAPSSASTGFKLGGAAATTTAPSSAAPAFGGFKLGGAGATTAATSAASTSAESKPLSLFGAKPAAAASSASEAKAETPAATSAAASAANPTAGTGFGGFKLSTTPTASTSGGTSTSTAVAAATATTADKAGKIAAVKPTTIANAALRGKTLEEIVQLWTTELSTQTRSFHAQANTVSYWDRALVQQGKRITELYEATVGVEAEQAVLDQSLDHMESQQNALQTLLDAYEGRLQDIARKTTTRPAGGRGATLTADEERDQVYSSAERLNTQLDELARRLTTLVEDVNSISNADPSGTSEGEGQRGAADPFAQIVQILNAQLTSLEWVDSQTEQLQERVKAAQRVHQEVVSAQASLSGAYGAGDLLGESARRASPSLTIPGGFSSDPLPPVTSSFGTPVSTVRKPAGSSLLGRGSSGGASSSPFASTPLRRGF